MATRPQHKPAYRRLCKTLRDLRTGAGMTQRELAKRLGLDHTMVHRSETGDRRIDPVEFAQWCRACEVDPGDAIREIR